MMKDLAMEISPEVYALFVKSFRGKHSLESAHKVIRRLFV